MARPFEHPELLALGIPFSFTLLGILLAHELGHYFTCRKYGIDVTYPYFIPAPTILGTFGAFIRIRSPIPTRKALFDVGLSGPVVGFVFAVPALIFAIAYSKVIPGMAFTDPTGLRFGNPPLVQLLIAMLRPHTPPGDILLASSRTRRMGGAFRHCAESAASLATRWRSHPLLSDEPVASADFAGRWGNHPRHGPARHLAQSLLGRLGDVGHATRSLLLVLPPSAADESLGAARSKPPHVGGDRPGSLRPLFHPLANH